MAAGWARSPATCAPAFRRSSGADAAILSVVIPTLNESARLPRLLADLDALDVPHEIIIADGGSGDGTPELAEARGCRVMRSAPGRGGQLRAGVAAATGAWLLVLHADVRLSRDALAEVERAMASEATAHAAWPLAIDGPGFRLRIIERGAALRWRLFGLAYGDQGLLVRRSLYDAAGGYPLTPIMEDVILTRRLRRLARGTRLHTPIRADARRWKRDGALRGSLRNVWLLALFLAGVSPHTLERWYRPEPRGR